MDDPKSGMVRVLRNGYLAYETPTRQCLVCERMENPEGIIVHTDLAWLCPECKSRLKKLIYKEEKT